MKPLPTIEDVARRCGVSTATVSRVLNNPDRVRAETRKKVETAVAELGYTPHFGGRALASNRTNTFGAVIPTMENAIFARGLQALQEELAEAGATLLVATSGYDPDKEEEQIRALLGRGVDGLVLIGETRKDTIYEMLARRAMPFVLVWIWRPDCPHACVGFDNRASARAIAEEVLNEGHREIAMISGISRGNDRAAERILGVREALAAAGIELRPDRLVETKYSLEAGREAAQTLLATSPRPTAIICGNDVLAAGALAAARAAGLAVPRDLSITGFDNIELSEVVSPPLTTVNVPHRRMGKTAADMLLRAARGDAADNRVVFRTDVVRRDSLGPAPAPKG